MEHDFIRADLLDSVEANVIIMQASFGQRLDNRQHVGFNEVAEAKTASGSTQGRKNG
jgi:hypothetical protein